MSFLVGVHGYPLPSVSRVQARHLDNVRASGAQTVGLYMTERERSDPSRWGKRLRDRLAASSLHCSHLIGPASLLVSHSERERKRAVASVAQGFDAVVATGAERLFVQPGGFSPLGPWWWHPLNFATASRDAITRSLNELGRHAEAKGVAIAVEGYQCSVLESPEVMREVIEDAGVPSVGANLDYVNFLVPRQVHAFEHAFEHMVAALGPRIVSMHVKDAVVPPRLSAHVEEVQAGDGVLDLAPVIRYACERGVPSLVEHLRPPRAGAAIAHLANVAAMIRAERVL